MSARSSRPGAERFRDIPLYAVETGACEIDVSDNTNLWGAPPAAIRALRALESVDLARYPEVYTSTLKRELGRYVGVGEECVVTGCGSDDVLDCAFRAFAGAGDAVAIPTPSFSAVPSVVRANGLTPVTVPLTADGDLDVERVLAVDASIIYLCSPNNPMGGELSRERVIAVVEGARGVVIVDEAYAEFAAVPLTDLARTYENVLVTRTLSKAFGLAGLRIGYGVGVAGLVADVEKARGPYKVSVTAERVAVAVLREDEEWVAARVREVAGLRAAFRDELARLGAPALPSSANFVLVPLRDAAGVAERMRARGVGVRAFRNLSSPVPGLAASGGEALRITIGPWAVMERVLEALTEALGEAVRR